jgi:hypothetical protein
MYSQQVNGPMLNRPKQPMQGGGFAPPNPVNTSYANPAAAAAGQQAWNAYQQGGGMGGPQGGPPQAPTMQQHQAELARQAQMAQAGGGMGMFGGPQGGPPQMMGGPNMDPRQHAAMKAQMGPGGPQGGPGMGMFGGAAGGQMMGGARPQVPWMSQGPGGMKPQMRPRLGGMANGMGMQPQVQNHRQQMMGAQQAGGGYLY